MNWLFYFEICFEIVLQTWTLIFEFTRRKRSPVNILLLISRRSKLWIIFEFLNTWEFEFSRELVLLCWQISLKLWINGKIRAPIQSHQNLNICDNDLSFRCRAKQNNFRVVNYNATCKTDASQYCSKITI